MPKLVLTFWQQLKILFYVLYYDKLTDFSYQNLHVVKLFFADHYRI